MLLRKIIGTGAWLLATALSGAILIWAMGTQDLVLSGIGILGLIFATTGVWFVMDARHDKAVLATLLSFVMWFTGEAFLVPSEYNFWSAKVIARAEREMDYQRQADGRRLILDNTAKQLRAEAATRPIGEIQADINAALAKTYARKTLASLTANCTDLSSAAIKFCRQVFAFQKELSAAQEHNTKSTLIWEANQRLDVNTSEAHGAHDFSANLSKLLGRNPEFWALIFTAITMLTLFVGRCVPQYLGWRQPKTAREVKAAAVTEGATSKDSLQVAETGIPATVEAAKEDPAPVTEAAEAANDNPAPVTPLPVTAEAEGVTPPAEEAKKIEDEPAPVTPKKRAKRKQAEEIDWSNVTAFPKIQMPVTPIDHLNEALDAFIDEHEGTGDTTTAAIGHRKIKAILKRAGAPLIDRDKFGDLVRERCLMRGIRVDSLVGRQWRFVKDDSVGKKAKRLGNNTQFSIPA